MKGGTTVSRSHRGTLMHGNEDAWERPVASGRRSLARPITLVAILALGMSSISSVGIAAAAAASTASAATIACGSSGTYVPLTGGCEYAAVGVDSFTVPAGWTQLTFDTLGAQGANGYDVGGAGGLGGEAKATLNVIAGEVFEISVGAAGSSIAGGTGGGASDVREGSCVSTLSCAFADRVIVAGGGGAGGGSDFQPGGAGGAGSGTLGTA